LVSHGFSAGTLHGDMEQDQRQMAIAAFKKGRIETLVATDVAARGLDVSDVTHVFNYHIPFDQESYVHRIGRTGRAGRKGKAITLVTPYEFSKLRRIQHAIKASFIHGQIPSLADVHKRKNEKLIKILCAQPVADGVVDLFAQLCEEMDAGEAACKVLSLLISKRLIAGPDKIGLSGQRLEAVVGRGGGGGGGGGGGSRPRQDGYAPRGQYRRGPPDHDARNDGPPRGRPPADGGGDHRGEVWNGKNWVRGDAPAAKRPPRRG
jgi:ATP-dependent RNA helicase DeaD